MRIKMSVNAKKKRRAVLKQVKGFWGARSRLYRVAKEAILNQGLDAYKGRKLRKRNFRTLWIARINAGCRMNGMSYSQFMNGLKKLNINLNRKVLADMAATDYDAFVALINEVKKAK
jgi:large subunit ribosomal protein L20